MRGGGGGGGEGFCSGVAATIKICLFQSPPPRPIKTTAGTGLVKEGEQACSKEANVCRRRKTSAVEWQPL